MKKKEVFMILSLVGVDQISKFLVTKFLIQSFTVIPHFFTLTYTENSGAAWSIFSGQRIFLILLSFLALILLYRMYPRFKKKEAKVFFLMLYSGILGNLIDRVIFGYVKDFLSFNLFHYQYPVFNLADVMIVIGALGALLVELWEEKYGNYSRNRRKTKN